MNEKKLNEKEYEVDLPFAAWLLYNKFSMASEVVMTEKRRKRYKFKLTAEQYDSMRLQLINSQYWQVNLIAKSIL